MTRRPSFEALRGRCCGGETLRLRILVRGTTDVIFQIYQVSSCGGSAGPGGLFPTPISSLPTDAWTSVETSPFAIPAGWTHANIYIRTTSAADIDRAFLGDPAEIFLEDFEVGEPCHFSATVP